MPCLINFQNPPYQNRIEDRAYIRSILAQLKPSLLFFKNINNVDNKKYLR